MIGVIDYEAGNTMSVIKALEYLGKQVVFTNDPDRLLSCDHIVFPGVGAYYDAMEKLREYNLITTIQKAVDEKIPFLGICLGMQLLFDESDETIGSDDPDADSIKGLGVLKGRIIRFPEKEGFKIPHMGWNSLKITNKESRLLKGIEDNTFVYFVHSYYLKASDVSNVAARSDFIHEFDCVVEEGNVFGCQFHPEKSGEQGLQILKNFCEI